MTELSIPRPAAARLRSLDTADLSQVAIWVYLAVAVGAGIFVRLWQINALGFNSDEAVYAGQAASIAHDPELSKFFPVFRAHPLLFQSILSLGFQFGVSDLFGRLLSAGFGVATVILAYQLGSQLYGRRAGLFAGLFMALMPYHVIVSRQVLLDGPMVFFSTLTLYLLARYALSGRAAWLYGAGAAMGLTFLSKETSILLLGAMYAFFALSPSVAIRLRDGLISLGIMALVILPFPISVLLAGRSDTGGQYLVWQLFRRPNHDWMFYPSEVPWAIGPLLIVVALAGLWLLRKERSWRETLLLSWIVVPALFFQLWPVKGFQYLLPIAPAFAVLAGRTLARWSVDADLGSIGKRLANAWVGPVLASVIALSLLIPAWQRVQPAQTDSFLAGSGGVPGGREAGAWINENVPEGGQILTIGPSMGNIVQFYGHRKAYGLAVSPNPLHRNPAYEPVDNPDLLIRSNELQYIVWDSFSADRSSFFSDKLLRYADRYHGRVVHTQTVTVDGPDGETQKEIIVIYEVRP